MAKPIKRVCIGYIEVKLRGEVYSRRYAMANFEMVVKLINDMFENEIKIEIVECKKDYEDPDETTT
jgi:hypothetical protein